MGSMLTMVGLSAASSAASAAGNYLTAKQQAATQKEMQKEQNDWQSSENDKDRDWQELTWLDHFLKENEEYSSRLSQQQNQWQSQFDITNAYNAPSAQMARLKAAGINPSAMLGAGQGSLASFGQSSALPSSSSSVTQPTPGAFGSHSVSPSPVPSFGGLSSVASSFSSVAQLADSLSKLKQVGLNTKRQEDMLPREVENVVEDTNLKRQKALLAEIETNVANAWLDKKAGAEFNKLVADSYAAYTLGDLNKANELLSSANERLVSLEGEIKAEQRPQLLANLKELQNVYKSEEERNRASAVASNAAAEQSLSSADYNKVITETERQLQEHKVSAQVLANAISRTQNQLLKRENIRDIETNEWKIWSIINECKKMGYATEEQLQRWRIAVKDKNSYELRLVLQEIQQVMPSVVVPIK